MSDSNFSSNCRFGVAARLKITGGYVYSLTGQGNAVWSGDVILVMDRIGSRRLCRVHWGERKQHSFFCLIPKKWLCMSFSRQEVESFKFMAQLSEQEGLN